MQVVIYFETVLTMKQASSMDADRPLRRLKVSYDFF
jgi:hypothetical protein